MNCKLNIIKVKFIYMYVYKIQNIKLVQDVRYVIWKQMLCLCHTEAVS
jgi:hypothetical protein